MFFLRKKRIKKTSSIPLKIRFSFCLCGVDQKREKLWNFTIKNNWQPKLGQMLKFTLEEKPSPLAHVKYAKDKNGKNCCRYT